MGLWDILTKDLKLGGHELSWHEPMLCRARLRGDLIWRIVIVLSAWLGATGLFLLIFAFNQNPPARSVAVGLGAVFGLGPAVLSLFFLKNQVSGSFKLYRDRLVRQRFYVGFSANWTETTTWGLGAIARYHLVSDDKVGQPFHVMFFKCEGEWDLVVLPSKIDLRKLQSLLTASGAEVKPANKIPDTFRQPLPLAVTGISGLVGIGLAVTGFLMFTPPGAANARQRPDMAQFQEGLPDPNLPIRVDPGFPAANRAGNDDPDRVDELPGLPGGGVFPGGQFQPGGFPRPQNQVPAGNPNTSVSNDQSVGAQSKLVGGKGGTPFTKVSAAQKPVIGIRYQMGKWLGQDHLGRIEPIFEAIEPLPVDQIVQADPGYALGAVEIHASEYVDGVRLVFMRLTRDGQLDPDDSYLSDWIGLATADPVRLEREGSPIIGFHGRAVAIVDALGVVFQE